MLRAGTPVPLVTLAEISSKTHKHGDRFELAVSEDVLVDGQVAIPRDARAIGEIAEHRAKGAFGRAGRLEIQLLHVEAAGRRIRLDGALADKGKDSAVPATDMNDGPGPVTDDVRADAQTEAESTNLHPRTE